MPFVLKVVLWTDIQILLERKVFVDSRVFWVFTMATDLKAITTPCLSTVIQWWGSTFRRMNHYPLDKYCRTIELSSGQWFIQNGKCYFFLLWEMLFLCETVTRFRGRLVLNCMTLLVAWTLEKDRVVTKGKSQTRGYSMTLLNQARYYVNAGHPELTSSPLTYPKSSWLYVGYNRISLLVLVLPCVTTYNPS